MNAKQAKIAAWRLSIIPPLLCALVAGFVAAPTVIVALEWQLPTVLSTGNYLELIVTVVGGALLISGPIVAIKMAKRERYLLAHIACVPALLLGWTVLHIECV